MLQLEASLKTITGEFDWQVSRLIGDLSSLPLESTPSSPNCLAKIHELEDVARNPLYNLYAQELIKNHQAYQTQTLYRTWEVSLEQQASRAGTPNLDQIQRTSQFALNEASSSGMNPFSRIAFIGSGPFPESLLALAANNIGGRLVGLDIDPLAVLLSKRLLSGLNLPNVPDIILQEATTANFAGFSHIIVAALAEPKDLILKQIRDTSPYATVVCRTTEGARSLIYPSVDESLIDISTASKVYGTPTTIVNSLIFPSYAIR